MQNNLQEYIFVILYIEFEEQIFHIELYNMF